MKNIKVYIILILIFVIPIIVLTPILKSKSVKESVENTEVNENIIRKEFVVAIHGGAGNFEKSDITEEQEKEYIAKLNEALDKGYTLLEEGTDAINVVTEVINILEDSPLFNAGKGAVFTHDGVNELDASIMDGSNLNAGSVVGVRNIKNPINAAKEVMINSEHVMLSGAGASEFAKEQGLEIVDPEYFYTEKRWESLQKILNEEKHGTVGCVVLDKKGNLAAGTSTGGRTNKKYGRIGDSPIIGAGSYANNNTCAVSATGHGEFFIRTVACYDISALMEYKGLPLQEAADLVVQEKLKNMDGNGGIVAVDNNGNVSFSFNTTGMFRGFANSDNEREVFLYRIEQKVE
jgi:L-asparaginase / beta-aspartyl-peptidase